MQTTIWNLFRFLRRHLWRCPAEDFLAEWSEEMDTPPQPQPPKDYAA